MKFWIVKRRRGCKKVLVTVILTSSQLIDLNLVASPCGVDRCKRTNWTRTDHDCFLNDHDQ